MKKYISIAVSIVLVLAIGYILAPSEQSTLSNIWTPSSSSGTSLSPNVTIKNGIQYVTVNAKGGYFPRNSIAKAGIPTKLVVKTENTYDCSSALVVPSVRYQAMLPASGETVVDIPGKASGEKLQASCGMGMYNFDVQFR